MFIHYFICHQKRKNEIIWSGGSTLALKFSYNHSMSKSNKIPIQGNEKSFKLAKSFIVVNIEGVNYLYKIASFSTHSSVKGEVFL